MPGHQEAARLAAIVQSSDDAIVSKDSNGIVMSWNPAAERIFGYTAAEAVGRSIRIIIPEDRQNEEEAVIDQIKSRSAREGIPLAVDLTDRIGYILFSGG